jgi:predicted small integral membrane protein
VEKSLMIRASKIILVGGIGCLALLVAINNVLDYESNFRFVQHVMSMDTVYPQNALKYRAITDPTLHTLVYVLIISTEFATAIFCLAGALRLLRQVDSDAQTFNRAKSLCVSGLTAGFALWFFGFMVVGAEWFCMWQSPDWNGQESAFRFVACILLVLIYTTQHDN